MGKRKHNASHFSESERSCRANGARVVYIHIKLCVKNVKCGRTAARRRRLSPSTKRSVVIAILKNTDAC